MQMRVPDPLLCSFGIAQTLGDHHPHARVANGALAALNIKQRGAKHAGNGDNGQNDQ